MLQNVFRFIQEAFATNKIRKKERKYFNMNMQSAEKYSTEKKKIPES